MSSIREEEPMRLRGAPETSWLIPRMFVDSWCLNQYGKWGWNTFNSGLNECQATQHHDGMVLPLMAKHNGVFVWMLSALDLITFLSGEAWRINSHSIDLPTSPTIHSIHSMHTLVTRAPLVVSFLHPGFQIFSPSLYNFKIKAFRYSLLSLRFLLWTDLIAACQGDSQWHLRVPFPLDAWIPVLPNVVVVSHCWESV